MVVMPPDDDCAAAMIDKTPVVQGNDLSHICTLSAGLQPTEPVLQTLFYVFDLKMG